MGEENAAHRKTNQNDNGPAHIDQIKIRSTS